MNARHVVSLLVVAVGVLDAGCSSQPAQPDRASDAADVAAAAPAPPQRTGEWSGRTETAHTWIVVKLTVDAPDRVSHFRFDTGCLGAEKSLVGWGPDQVSGINEVGQFSFAGSGFIVKGVFHGDAFVAGEIVDDIGFGMNCPDAKDQHVPDRWRIAPGS